MNNQSVANVGQGFSPEKNMSSLRIKCYWTWGILVGNWAFTLWICENKRQVRLPVKPVGPALFSPPAALADGNVLF